MKSNQKYVLREVAGKVFLVHTEKKATVHYINEAGAMLWELLLKGTNLEEMKNTILAEYDAEEADVEADINEFLEILYKIGALEEE